MGLNLRDLPPELQKQALAAAGVKPKRPKKAGSTAFSGHCHYCKQRLGSGAAMERHRVETGHARFEVWPPLSSPVGVVDPAASGSYPEETDRG